MYTLSRLMLLATVVLVVYVLAAGCVVGLTNLPPETARLAGLALVGCALVLLALRKGRRLAACAVLAALWVVRQVPPESQGLAWVLLALGVLALLARKKVTRLLTSGGTASWATIDALRRAGFLHARKGLILGRVPSEGMPAGQAVGALLNPRLSSANACHDFFTNLNRRRRRKGQLVRLPDPVHVSVFCPTGGGKGVSCIVPFLQTCDESCVVADGKDGELARLTAAARRRMGHQVILLDPERVVTQRPDTLNPLDFIDERSPRAVAEAAGLANALVVRTGEEKQPHFLDRAEHWFTALTGLALCHGRRDNGTRSLVRVAEIASNPEALKGALALMQQHPEVWGGSLARMGGMLSHSVGEELASTLSTVGRFISFINSPSVAESLRSSSFDLSKLRQGKRKMTIFLIQRASDSRVGSAMLRLWLNASIREVMKGGLGQKQKVHCLVDEAGSVGRMESLKDVLNVGRGFGLRMQLYYQDTGQLSSCWENPQGVLANTTKIFFGTQHYETAEIISKSLGPQTIEVYSGGTNNGWSRGRSNSSGQSYSESGNSSYSGGSSSNWQSQSRDLLKPDEVLQLDPRVAITLTPGMRPICTRLIRYYEERALLKRRGLLRRLAAAVWTLLLSALLLALAGVTAAAVTPELRAALDRPFFTPDTGLPRPWDLPDDRPPAEDAPGRPWGHLPQ